MQDQIIEDILSDLDKIETDLERQKAALLDILDTLREVNHILESALDLKPEVAK